MSRTYETIIIVFTSRVHEYPKPMKGMRNAVEGGDRSRDDEEYDTLDDVMLADMCVEELYEKFAHGLMGTLGVSIGGENILSVPGDGYWGRAITLATGEQLQLRMLPRKSFGIPLGPNDFRLVATRRTSHSSAPVVGAAIVFLPRDTSHGIDKMSLSMGQSVGCRGIHVLLPSLFSKHDSRRTRAFGSAVTDQDGFHSVRPSSVLLPQPQKRGFALTSGDAYLVMAGHMAGVDMPSPLGHFVQTMKYKDHQRQIEAKERKLVQSIGRQDTTVYAYSALTLCELLSAEGYVSMMSNSFFNGALPDMAFSPIGIPLSLCLAVHVACYPKRFNAAPCTKTDEFVNKELIRSFHSRWKRVLLGGFRALDVAMKSGFDRALLEVDGNVALKRGLEDSILLWQRIGQRLICKILADPREEATDHDLKDAYHTKYGKSDLLNNPVTNAKYDCLAKSGMCRPVVESPVDKISLSPLCDQRTTLYRILDNSEGWLRTGMFGEVRITKENVNVAPLPTCRGTRLPCTKCGTCMTCDCKIVNSDSQDGGKVDTSSSDESDDVDDLMDNKLNVCALETASGAIATSMIHGPFSQHMFNIKSFLLGPGAKNKCADCDKDVTALQAMLFGSKSDQCRICKRRRCFRCANDALKASKSPSACCVRCDAPSADASVSAGACKKSNRCRPPAPKMG